MKLFIVVVLIVITSFLLRILKLLMGRISESNPVGKKIQLAEPLIVLVVWIILTFWIVYYLFYDKPYYNFIVFALIGLVFLLVSWFFVRDFVAGVAFRIQNNYSVGDIVQFGSVSGRIDNLFLTHVSIFTNEGKLVKIPYTRLSNEIVSQKSSSGSFGKNQVLLKLPKKKNADELKDTLMNLLLNSPWRVATRKPVVKLKSEWSDSYEFEIQLETRNEKHLDYVVSYLKNRFGLIKK